MKRILFAVFAMALLIQGCSNNQSLKEDVKDVGQDMKNAVNKATD